jgi:hypothetical protein
MWREIAAGRFPKPVPIAARRVAFFQDEIDAWLARRRRCRAQRKIRDLATKNCKCLLGCKGF